MISTNSSIKAKSKSATTLILATMHLMVSAQQNDSVRESSVSLLAISPLVGYDITDIRYSIAGNEHGESPNILSELIWSNAHTIQYGLEAKGRFTRKIPLKLRYTRSKVFKGSVSDIDYAEDNRQAIFSEQYLSSHDGFGTHVNVQLGYVMLDKSSFSISCLAGFDYMHQRVYILNPKGTNKENAPPDYIDGLRSYYSMNWKSLGVNLWVDYHIFQPLSVHVDLGAYKSSYDAYGNWNLIADFAHPKSYIHRGKGFRSNCTFSLFYRLNKTFRFSFGYINRYAMLRDGKDQLYLENGKIQNTRLNEVRFRANSVTLGIAYILAILR